MSAIPTFVPKVTGVFMPGDSRSPGRSSRYLVLAAISALAAAGSVTSNGLLTSFAIASFGWIVFLLFTRGEPPVLMFCALMQWLQASAAIFYTDFYGLSLTQEFGSGYLTTASWLSEISILVLAVGMRLALIGRRSNSYKVLAHTARSLNLHRAFFAYLTAYIVATAVQTFAWTIPGLAQILLPVAGVKWVFLYIFSYSVLEQRREYHLVFLAAAVEVATGLLGYFAAFKTVFFVFALAALASQLSGTVRKLALVIVTCIALLAIGIFWSAIKMEYRDYLNQGSGQQVVEIPVEERATKLGELFQRMTWNDFVAGLDVMVLRISYVNYFALVLMNVPDAVPFENGALWAGTLQHTFTPRLLFSGKAAIDDSERTAKYTGLMTTGAEQGTSVSIGYVGESYIDFGPMMMFIPILLLGVFYGAIYRVFALHLRHALLGAAIAVSILVVGGYTIETSNIKLVGGNIAAVVVLATIYRLLGGSMMRWLSASG